MQPAEEFALAPARAATNRDAGEGWFEASFREHYPRVVGLLARLTGDRGQAEEIAAEVFSKLSRQPGLEGDGITPWIFRVATNAGLDAVRTNQRRRQREDAANAESRRTRPEGDALEQMLREERRARVREVLGTMKPRDAQMLLLRAEGLAYREVAVALGMQPGSVGTLLARAEAEFERRFRARHGGVL